MPELTGDDAVAAAAAQEIEAGTDKIWIPIDFLEENIPPPKAPLPAIAVQIMRMTVVERVKVALMGGKDARMILAHDNNRMVRRYVLYNPRITDSEMRGLYRT